MTTEYYLASLMKKLTEECSNYQPTTDRPKIELSLERMNLIDATRVLNSALVTLIKSL